MTSDGYIFEREEIKLWLQQGIRTNPITSKPLESTELESYADKWMNPAHHLVIDKWSNKYKSAKDVAGKWQKKHADEARRRQDAEIA